jgi:hypothetical protein
MKTPKKKAARRSFRVPPWLIALGVLAVLVVVPWLLLSEPASSSAPRVGVSPTVQWTPLVSQQHGFRITLPAPPQDLTPPLDLAREIDSTWTALYTGGTFMVKVTKCPERLCTEAPDSVLKGMSESIREGLGGTTLSEKRVEVSCPQGTCPGLEFEATARQGFKVSARIFATRDKIFQLMGTQFSGSEDHFRKAVDSFSFL